MRLRDDVVTIRPIAGTRKRGTDAEEDAANADTADADTSEDITDTTLDTLADIDADSDTAID